MADVNLDIRATDRGARRLVQDLVQALLGLKRANQEAVNDPTVARSTQEALRDLQQRLALSQQLLVNRKHEVEELRRLGEDNVANTRQESARLIEAAKTTAAENNRVAREARSLALGRIQVAKDAVQQEIQAQNELLAAVRQTVEKRIDVERRANAASDAAAQARINSEKSRLRQLIDQRDQERRILNERIRAAIRERKAAEARRDVSVQRVIAAPEGPIRRAAVEEAERRRIELERARNRVRELREEKAINVQRLNDQIVLQRGIVDSEKRTAAAKKSIRDQSLRDSITSGKREITEQKQQGAEAIRLARQRLNLLRGAGSEARRNASAVTTAGRDEIATARAIGRAQVISAQETRQSNNQRARSAVKAANDQVVSDRRAVNSTRQRAREEQQAARRAIAAYRSQARATGSLEFGLRRLRSRILQLIAAYAGFRAIEGFIARGIAFNQMIESSRLGIAALITAEADLVDQHGKLITGTQALAAAQSLAADQLDKLRIAGIQTSATTQELILAFQEAVGAGVAVGLTLDQIRKFSVQVAQAATAINLPTNQLQQEVRSILQSTIDRNSRLAKALLITNAQVNAAKEQNRLFDFLNQKFRAFTIAGVKSVETFSALKSNIEDAASVLAGFATSGLFERLRDVGQESLRRIFDFRTADITKSFQGLVAGLNEIFSQIGDVLSSAIRTAVDRAEALSRWMRDNRQIVRETGVAVGTMVFEFGRMIQAIIIGIANMLSFGRSVNTVAGAARTLAAIFKAIADNVQLIIGLLVGRALIGGLLKIASAVKAIQVAGGVLLALRGALAGGAAGSALLPGIGTIIGGVVGLAAAYKLLKKDEQEARLEAVRLGSALEDQRNQALPLAESYERLAREVDDLQRQLKSTKLSEESRRDIQNDLLLAQRRLAETGRDLVAVDKSYADVVDVGNQTLEQRREALIRVMQAQTTAIALELSASVKEQQLLRQRKEAAAEEIKVAAARRSIFEFRGADRGAEVQSKQIDQSKEIADQLDVENEKVAKLTRQYQEFKSLLEDLLRPRAEVRQRPEPTEDTGETAAERRIKQAQTEFDRRKAELDADRAKFDALLAERQITAEQHIRALAEIEQREVDAEINLLLAREEEATRKRDAAARAVVTATKAKAKEAAQERLQAAEDEVRSFDALFTALGFKRRKIDADTNAALVENAEQRAARILEIEQRFLQARGRHFEAASLEIQRKNERALRQAAQEFGTEALRLRIAEVEPGDLEGMRRALREMQAEVNKSPLLAKFIVAIDAEVRQEQLDVVQDEIRRIQAALTAETQAIQADFKRRGKLSADQKQQLSNQIAAANARATDATMELRHQLELLLATVQTPLEETAIKQLLDQLDAIRTRATEVNLEMQRLQEGIRESFESGLAGFFEELGTGAESVADSFKKMVKSIIDDIRRLMAQLLARQIVNAVGRAIFGAAAGAATVQATGNTTQSGGRARGGLAQGRAEGGPAYRPSHGVLHGGVPGKDSIPILAQQDEYFVKRQATRYYGADFMDLINEMRLPLTWAREMFSLMRSHFTVRPLKPRLSFAQGGSVGLRSRGARPVQDQVVHHLIGLDQNGALTWLSGPGGREIVKGHLAGLPRFISNGQKALKKSYGTR